jgi:hypothetical protein
MFYGVHHALGRFTGDAGVFEPTKADARGLAIDPNQFRYNSLTVLSGRKRVFLFPPSESKKLYPAVLGERTILKTASRAFIALRHS